MADRETNSQSEENQIKHLIEALDSIDPDQLNHDMAPKDVHTKKIDPNAQNGIDDEDLEEIANVDNNLDLLNSALDTIEERADRIRAQLLELLTSNREIRQSLREENEKSGKDDGDDADSTLDDLNENENKD